MAIGTPVLKASDVGSAGYPATVTIDEACAAGGTLFLRVSLRDNGGGAETVVTVSDTAGNTWVRSVWIGTATQITKAQIWRCSDNLALAVNDTITISVSGAAATDRWTAQVHSVDGLTFTSPLDTSASATGTSTTPSSGDATTTNADDILLGLSAAATPLADGDPTQDSDYLPSTGFFLQSAEVNGFTNQGERGYRIVSATVTDAYNHTLATSRTWAALVGAFKAAAPGGLSIPVAVHHYNQMAG